MTLDTRIAAMHDDLTKIRRHIHANPELLFDVQRTAALVTDELTKYGVDDVVNGIGRTGVVGVIKGSRSGSVIGLRADMDALPLQEEAGPVHASKIAGRMHACGHDGHTTMLLGAARYLAETRDFAGTVIVIFQPAEEGGGGGREMVNDGLMERFGIDHVYGLHIFPNDRAGTFAIRKGPILAAVDTFSIRIGGRGGHAAKPQATIDPIVAGANVVSALQTIASRSADPKTPLVVSVTSFNAGQATNVIPQEAILTGTVRSLSTDVRDLAEQRIKKIVPAVALAYGCTAELTYERLYPVMSNHLHQTEIAADVAATLVGEEQVNRDYPSSMGGEDFAFMLEARPGAMIFLGQGPGPELHNTAFDFNDAVIPLGVAWWVQLVKTANG
ncbi:M20 aminoacylase family protein [Lentibacter sp. XHP0401]|uniref:M20 aminoacylase family protein n=1 Tax=Lentibacter sp. XHP0401 TaxID=2984334 RepID=UPI0021E7E288|nr:M20 aminoacylase family protein [Lentibacter sp. XHP0401]MCV2894968.1 M20 family metallopeptidase [Lentibacter sp. XHP0401]